MPSRATMNEATPVWPFHQTFRVRYHDIDALQHLNHAAYFVFMETLRCSYYLSFVNAPSLNSLDIIIAEASCRFLAPAIYDTEILGEVVPSRPLGSTSFTLLYRFLSPDRETKYASGRTVVVCYDYSTNRKKPISQERRAVLERDAIDPASEGWK